MAGRQTTPQGLPGLQSLVQNIVSNIVGGNGESSEGENVNIQSSNSDNVTQELHARFSIPRQYNPRQNYGRSTTPRRRSRQTFFTNSRCNERVPQMVSKQGPKNDFFIKNIILLPVPTHNRVPRGDTKEFLNSRGLVIDCYEFDKKWEQEELVTKLSELFINVLHDKYQSFVK